MVNTKVKLGEIFLENPIIPASGTFGFGEEFKDLYDLNILGSISIKGITCEERFGNPLPRISEGKFGLINAVGLENPGINEVTNREIPNLAKVYKKKIITNISGFSLEEYVTLAQIMEKVDQVGIIEVNVSCPNVYGGGMAFGQDTESIALVTREVKKVTSKPVYIKLSPNVTSIIKMALACQEAGADGLSMINTVLAMDIDVKKREPILANTYGGLSGPAIFPIALRMVHQVAKEVDIPIIGIGGVTTAMDVIKMIMAGATAVQVGTANLINPWVCKEIIEELPIVMQELGITSLEEIRRTVS